LYYFSGIREKLKSEVAEIKAGNESFAPHLAIIQVGEREDSSLYVRMKMQAAEQVGISAFW
jgi:methylenetetrahydrofolate dehydrogenase (NADP+)/methenyltetrahydrofolate cyclohydrolase/formyltetrahydrofolate synthetase